MTEQISLKRKRQLWSNYFCLLLVVSLVSPFLPGQELHTVSAENADKVSDGPERIVAYYTNWANYGRGHQVLDLDVSNITHILYAFGDFCWEGRDNRESPPRVDQCYDYKEGKNMPNGLVVSSDPWADTDNVGLVRLTDEEAAAWDVDYYGNFGAFRKLKKDNPHLKVMFTLGGWTLSKHFSDVVNDDAARKIFAESAVDFIRKYDLDGIDIDWEYPVGGGQEGNSNRPEDKRNHTLLLQDLRDELDKYGPEDGKDYELSIASSANPDYLENNEMYKIGEILDFINIMTYDFYVAREGVNGHNAALHADYNSESQGAALYNVETAIIGHLEAGIPPEKLVMGMPMYGRSWAGCSGEYTECDGPGEGTWEDGVLDYDDILLMLSHPENKFTRHWNNLAKVPYLTDNAGNFISFDDVHSIALKAELAQEYNLGGAMFWELSQDRKYDMITTVIDVYQGIDRNVTVEVGSTEKIEVTKGKKITGVEGKSQHSFEIDLPINLPVDTAFRVEKVKGNLNNLPDGYIVDGVVYDFDFTYPEYYENFNGEFSLTLLVDKEAEGAAVHYYNAETEAWELVDADAVAKDGEITVQVNHFSHYAVLKEGTESVASAVKWALLGIVLFVLLVGVIWFNVYRKKLNADDALL